MLILQLNSRFLRKKIDPGFFQNFVRTYPGCGLKRVRTYPGDDCSPKPCVCRYSPARCRVIIWIITSTLFLYSTVYHTTMQPDEKEKNEM